MRALLAVLLAATAACAQRQVEVRTGNVPSVTTPESAIHMTNNLTQPVNVYVVSGGTDVFVKQVAPNSTEDVPVRGVAGGSNVSLKATTVDGTRTYTKDNVTLSGSFAWQVP